MYQSFQSCSRIGFSSSQSLPTCSSISHRARSSSFWYPCARLVGHIGVGTISILPHQSQSSSYRPRIAIFFDSTKSSTNCPVSSTPVWCRNEEVLCRHQGTWQCSDVAALPSRGIQRENPWVSFHCSDQSWMTWWPQQFPSIFLYKWFRIPLRLSIFLWLNPYS